jgi:peptidoglycan endopeptidase LytF
VNRKHTILLAVFINAAMLIVLFAMAWTTQEEIALAPTHEVSEAAPTSKKEPAMFGEELDFLLRAETNHSSDSLLESELAHDTKIAAAPPNALIIHSLPPVAPVAVQETVAAPSTPSKPLNAQTPILSNVETRVKKGDTLEKLAKTHHTTVDEIIKLNHLPSSFLRVGQVLKLPQEKSSELKPVVVEKQAVVGPEYYTVKVGDNPWMIANKHHLKLEELLKLNGLNEEKARKLKPGDRLRIK